MYLYLKTLFYMNDKVHCKYGNTRVDIIFMMPSLVTLFSDINMGIKNI